MGNGEIGYDISPESVPSGELVFILHKALPDKSFEQRILGYLAQRLKGLEEMVAAMTEEERKGLEARVVARRL